MDGSPGGVPLALEQIRLRSKLHELHPLSGETAADRNEIRTGEAKASLTGDFLGGGSSSPRPQDCPRRPFLLCLRRTSFRPLWRA